MSQFNKYVKRVSELAHAAFDKYANAYDQRAAAKKAVDNLPAVVNINGNVNTTSENTAGDLHRARLQTELLEAEQNLHSAESFMREKLVYMRGDLRDQLAADIEKLYETRAEDVDDQAVKIIGLDILTPEEVYVMLDKYTAAHNETMRRYIGKYADTAAAKPDALPEDVTAWKSIAAKSSVREEESKLEDYDRLVTIYSMTIANPAMMLAFPQMEIVKETLKNF